MSEMVKKIPIQDKIADLERRIERLEKDRTVTISMTETKFRDEVESHWDEMWKHFGGVIHEVFGGNRK